MTSPLNLAVAGYGQISEQHCRIARAEGHRLHHLVGRRAGPAAAFAARHGFTHHGTRLEDALADPATDAVVLGTPSDQHAGQARQCLEAGKPVLVEIPLAMSYAEGLQIAETAEATGIPVMVGHNHRYLPPLAALHRRVTAGQDRFDQITARYLLMRRTNVGSSGYRRSWTDNLLWHHVNHSTDIALWLLGVDDPADVDVSFTQARPDPAAGTPLALTLVLHTRDDAIATVVGSYNNDTPQVYDYFLTGPGRSVAVEQNVLRDATGVLHTPTPGDDDADRVLLDREFFAAVREGRPPAISPRAVLPALAVLQRAQDLYDRRPGAAAP